MRYLGLNRWVRYATLSLLTFTSIGFTALAQNEVRDDGTLDEVIVTAQRTPEVKSQSATTISIITRKELVEHNKTMPDMQAIVVPNYERSTQNTRALLY